MIELYVNTHDPLEIGEIGHGSIFGPDGEKSIAIKCIRPASKDEYLNFVNEQKLNHMVRRSIDNPKLYFYLVEVLD